jgi:chemotaxis response regulator CheB
MLFLAYAKLPRKYDAVIIVSSIGGIQALQNLLSHRASISIARPKA